MLNNSDMTNAFASTNWSRMDQVMPSLFLEQDLHFAEQRYRWATCRLPTGDLGPSGDHRLLLRIGCGALIGDPFAVVAFSHCFSRAVAHWGMAHRHIQGQEDSSAFWCESPIPRGGYSGQTAVEATKANVEEEDIDLGEAP